MRQDLSTNRRSVLYVPASNQRALEKSLSLSADAVIFDLEDSVARIEKNSARQTLLAHLNDAESANCEVIIRVNSLDDCEFESDLAAVAKLNPDAVLLPKVGSVHDLHAFAKCAEKINLTAQTKLWCMIETPAGITELKEIVKVGVDLKNSLNCIVVGTNDIAKDSGIYPGEGRQYLLPWLMNIVLIAKRYGVDVLDGVWNDFKNLEGLKAEATQGSRMGFSGKTLIHPSQIEIANKYFSPSEETIADAKMIVDAFKKPENTHSNVINLDGRMIERLHYEQALKILKKFSNVNFGSNK